MKTNWLKTVSTINQQRYIVPEGWDTRDQVAESLQCDPSKVADLLKPGIEAGEIERQQFSVWDANRRMAVPTVCYRIKSEKSPAKFSTDLDEKIASSIRRNPNHTNAQIAKCYRGTTSGQVAAIRKTMQS